MGEIKKIKDLVEKGFISKNEKKALDSLISELKASWPQSKIKIFGSKVKGIADEESDVDILILLPYEVTEEIRRQIIHRIFDINLTFETNLSALIMAEKEWERGPVSLLPIHVYIEEEGVLYE
jgi:predicted nucleotidyltransferase